ncbi:MAG: methionine--tRNA ligase subunit beta [Candidatus Nanoarchaeia archaeon]|nr:methionine--tRNA ligase subunit beta [Candidatus Nanoarchaeia archaeon]MDD5587746.1 methionine--tRNA ligase subunit beta [Candidatus Nanoarchaeia archaeon]
MVEGIKKAEHCGDKITIDEFGKVDLRIAQIKAVKNHPNADKLYILDVSLGKGEHDVQIVAGIRQAYTEDELIGKKIIMVRNLEPAVLRGVESEGMLLAAEFKGKIVLLTVDKDIETGAKIK